jgi:hypothetical protein
VSANSPSGLSSSSTLAEIEAVYDDNASYMEDSSAAECLAFITAGRMLLRRYAAEAQKAASGNRLRLDENIRQINAQLAQASEWLNSASAAGNQVITPSFQFLRGY